MANTTLKFDLPAPDISAWRAGNTGTEGVWHFDSGKPGRNVLISALIHGNEICGAWALKGLLEAAIRPQRGALTLMFCNLAAFDTFDAARPDAARFVDEDLNRQWSPARLQSGSSLERRRAAELRPFVEQADWLLDLHSMHEPSAPLLLTGVQPRNLDLARQLRAPEHIVVDAGHSDGVRMRDFGRFGLPDDAAGDTRSLLIECGWYKEVDLVWLVAVDEQTQIERAMARSGMSQQEVEVRIAAQMTLAAKCQYADLIIDNSGSLKQTELTVKKEWEKALHMED